MPEATPGCRLLAQLTEPDRYQAALAPVVELTPAQVTHWCQRNRYPLMAIATHAPPWLAEDATFQRELEAENTWYETQRREYVLVREAWLQRGITCLMIKSAGNYPSFPHTSDNIDVLVRPEQAPMARDILRQLGYVEVRNVEEPHKFLFRKFHAGSCVSAVHVHEQVIWLVGFMDEEALWARLRPADDDPLVNVPSPEDAILINLAHACYENKELRLNDVARVRHALRSTGGQLDWAYMERVAAERGWLDGLAFMLLVHAWLETALYGSTLIPREQQQRLETLLRPIRFAWRRLEVVRAGLVTDLPFDPSYWFCKWLYYRKILSDPQRPSRKRLVDVGTTLLCGIKLKSGIRPQPGAVVCLSGPDGSGKTAHAEALVEALRLCEIRADYLWSRGGSSGALEAVSHLRRQTMGITSRAKQMASGEALEESPLVRRRRQLAHPFARFAWSWLVAVDQVVTYILRAHVPALLGRVVVSDRYVYDTAVEMDASLPANARWSRMAIRAMLTLVPQPQFGYVLDVSSATRKSRKADEVWLDDLESERRRYQAIAHQFGLQVLSTEGAFDESNDRLIRHVMMGYMRGFETWLNSLFMANPSQRNVPDPAWAKGARLATSLSGDAQ